MTIEDINGYLGQIDARQSHYQQLRAVAAGAVRQGVDNTGRFVLAGSIASDVVNVLEASLIGKVDLRVEPQDDLADALITGALSPSSSSADRNRFGTTSSAVGAVSWSRRGVPVV